jgi:hypothetical protein
MKFEKKVNSYINQYLVDQNVHLGTILQEESSNTTSFVYHKMSLTHFLIYILKSKTQILNSNH